MFGLTFLSHSKATNISCIEDLMRARTRTRLKVERSCRALRTAGFTCFADITYGNEHQYMLTSFETCPKRIDLVTFALMFLFGFARGTHAGLAF